MALNTVVVFTTLALGGWHKVLHTTSPHSAESVDLQSLSALSHVSDADQTQVKFFMYTGDAFQPDLCDDDGNSSERELPRGGYYCIGSEWARHTARHPWRVMDPNTADIFVIPFDVCASHASRRACHGAGHVQRLEAVVAALNESQWFHRRGGKDHMWVMPHIWLPAALTGKRKWGPGRGRGSAFFLNPPRSRLIENMTIGRYLSYHLTLRDTLRVGFMPKQHDWLREEEKWRCTLVLPIVTPLSLRLERGDSTFDRWDQRKIFIFFRGNGGLGGGCFMKTAEEARARAVELGKRNLPWPGKTIMTNDHAPTAEAYRGEILDAKYCLVFACDDPQTSRFFEAIAAGCIPVVINDAWRVAVAPFASRVNYDAFAITIPEAVWAADPAAAAHLIYNRPLGERRRMFHALVHAQREVLWRHEDSNAATNALLGARDCLA